MLSENDVEQLMRGQSIYREFVTGFNNDRRVVQLTPIRSRKDGRVVRVLVHSATSMQGGGGRGSHA